MTAEKEKRSDRKADVFADIAAQRPHRQENTLLEPQPPARPGTRLPVTALPPPEARFKPRPRRATQEELKQDLHALRKKYEPFLKNTAPPLPQTRVRETLDLFQWRQETDRDRADFNNVLDGKGSWEEVHIPHYKGPLGRAVTYYRTTFSLSSDMMSKDRLFVCFKGVDYKAHVFANNTFLGSHEGFFAPFEFDFTPHARNGRNTLVVKVENDAICTGNDSWGENGADLEGNKIYAATGVGYDDPEIGWHHCPPGMGIYQDVIIEGRSALFIHDVFVRPVPEENRAEAWVEVWNSDIYRHPVELELAVYGQNFDAIILENHKGIPPGPLGPGVNYLRFSIDLPEHRAWEPETPWLYQLQVKLANDKESVLDYAARQFGMRSFVMDTENAPRGRMFLNGRDIRLRGANTMGFEQQDVMNRDWDQLIDDILLAKLCNMNFWRLTQRPVQPEVYDYCDRLGLMTQTDLPLFGVLRRNQFCEAVRQAEDMERLIRSHPCTIMVSYINEPFGGARGKPHRHLLRDELERFFLAADQAVWQANPDRVIKAVDGDYDPPGPGLPDNHCYCCWYNGHGVEVGKLHRGYWQRVKPGWMYGCGEFGAEGLEDADLMHRRYPEHWLPRNTEDERTWSPDAIVKAQTGRFHYMWFDTQHSLEDWVAASQAHQAWATRIMTEAFRRDNRMNTFAIHLFIDAFPAGWMKSIMDVERRPKPAFFAYREALTPLMVNLRTDRYAFFAGEKAQLEAWICNDTDGQLPKASLAYRLEVNGDIIAGGQAETTVPPCNSACRGLLECALPNVDTRTPATVRLALLGTSGKVIHDTAVQLSVFPAIEQTRITRQAVILGGPEGKTRSLAKEMELEPLSSLPTLTSDIDPQTLTILIDDMAALESHKDDVTSLVRQGALAILLELQEGEHTVASSTVTVTPCGMGPVQFVSRATGHPLVRQFAPDDFKFWYDDAVGYPTPLLERTFAADGWQPILSSGNGAWGSDWSTALAAAEKKDGKGAWRICNVKLAGRIQGNPVATLFARGLLTE